MMSTRHVRRHHGCCDTLHSLDAYGLVASLLGQRCADPDGTDEKLQVSSQCGQNPMAGQVQMCSTWADLIWRPPGIVKAQHLGGGHASLAQR